VTPPPQISIQVIPPTVKEPQPSVVSSPKASVPVTPAPVKQPQPFIVSPPKALVQAVPVAGREPQPMAPRVTEPVEVTGVTFHQKDRLLDVTVRNTTDNPAIIHQIVVDFRYVVETSTIVPSGRHDLGILQKSMERARARKQPFSFRKGFNVAYLVPPKGSDRYVFDMNMAPRDLYTPELKGRYCLSVHLRVNNSTKLTANYTARLRDSILYLIPDVKRR
jgi:hypothetical protein